MLEGATVCFLGWLLFSHTGKVCRQFLRDVFFISTVLFAIDFVFVINNLVRFDVADFVLCALLTVVRLIAVVGNQRLFLRPSREREIVSRVLQLYFFTIQRWMALTSMQFCRLLDGCDLHDGDGRWCLLFFFSISDVVCWLQKSAIFPTQTLVDCAELHGLPVCHRSTIYSERLLEHWPFVLLFCIVTLHKFQSLLQRLLAGTLLAWRPAKACRLLGSFIRVAPLAAAAAEKEVSEHAAAP